MDSTVTAIILASLFVCIPAQWTPECALEDAFCDPQDAQWDTGPLSDPSLSLEDAAAECYDLPHDPTHRNFAFNKNGAKFAPKVPGVLDSSHVPDCAGCSGLNPFINPFDASHQAGVLAGHQAGFGAGQQRRPVAARPAAPRPQQPLLPVLRTTTTPAPKRFFPPGQLSLNRFEN